MSGMKRLLYKYIIIIIIIHLKYLLTMTLIHLHNKFTLNFAYRFDCFKFKKENVYTFVLVVPVLFVIYGY